MLRIFVIKLSQTVTRYIFCVFSYFELSIKLYSYED